MDEKKEIGTYAARVHWSRLLHEVSNGTRYVIKKHHRAVAVLMPPEALETDADSADARELHRLLEEFQVRHASTLKELEQASGALARLRANLNKVALEDYLEDIDRHEGSRHSEGAQEALRRWVSEAKNTGQRGSGT